ncbi:hypothetical protein L0Y41_03290 [bacterium]|nr:hypothetical protein [bacterium]
MTKNYKYDNISTGSNLGSFINLDARTTGHVTGDKKMAKEQATATEKKSNKPTGWHSRQHQTSDANREARARYQAAHGLLARQSKAEARGGKKTPAQQLAALDSRLGKGAGAARERARLMALLAS